jgi:murein tripeptide amidase MpaA
MLSVLAAITVAASFEGGSIGRVENVSPTHLRCAVKGQADQDGRNRQANWYYFRLDGLPKAEIQIEFTDLAGEYNYRAGAHSMTRDTRPVYSYDNRTWIHFRDEDVSWDEKQVRLSVRFRPERGRAWIAHTPPYTTEHLGALLTEIGKHPHVTRTSAGKTTQGRELPLITITDPAVNERDKKVVWVMARQHAWETGTSWVMDGALRWLASEDAQAAQLRRSILWKFFPMADPDGVVNGQVRFNTNGYDVNRNWDTADARRTPEIFVMKKAMLGWIDSGHRIDLFLAMHNQEAGDYIDGPFRPEDDHARRLAQRFFEGLEKTDSFQAARGPRNSLSQGPIARGRMTVNQALAHERRIPAFLMELGVERNVKLGRLRTTEDNQRFGPTLVRTLAGVVSE